MRMILLVNFKKKSMFLKLKEYQGKNGHTSKWDTLLNIIWRRNLNLIGKEKHLSMFLVPHIPHYNF